MKPTNIRQGIFNSLLGLFVFVSFLGTAQIVLAQADPMGTQEGQDPCTPCRCETCCPEDRYCSCCPDIASQQADLSGTYTGTVSLSGGHEMSGQGTLTITGNTFTLESEGMTHTGRVVATTTRGYTGAAFYFTDITDPVTNTRLAVSVRARHSGSRLTLTPAPGARNRLFFNSGGGGRGRRGRRGRAGGVSQSPRCQPGQAWSPPSLRPPHRGIAAGTAAATPTRAAK